MPADVSKWTLQSLESRNEAKAEAVKLNDVEGGKTGVEVDPTGSRWSTTMMAAVAGGVLLVVAGIVTTVIILVTMGGGGFLEMSAVACPEGESIDYVAIGFSAGSNVWTTDGGTKTAVQSDLIHYYLQNNDCAVYDGPTTGADGWVPLYLPQNENKPALPDDWTLTAAHLVFGPEEEINEVKMYPLHMIHPVSSTECMLYYKAGDATTEETRYNSVTSLWPAIDHSGAPKLAPPKCVASPPPSPPPPSPPL